MSVLTVLLGLLLAFASLLLVAIVLMQDSKGGGLAGAFGGAAGSELLGTSGQKQIAKVTAWISAVFFVLCIGIGLMKSWDEGSSTVVADDPGTEAVGADASDPRNATNPTDGITIGTEGAPGGGVTITTDNGPGATPVIVTPPVTVEPTGGSTPDAPVPVPAPAPGESTPPAGGSGG